METTTVSLVSQEIAERAISAGVDLQGKVRWELRNPVYGNRHIVLLDLESQVFPKIIYVGSDGENAREVFDHPMLYLDDKKMLPVH